MDSPLRVVLVVQQPAQREGLRSALEAWGNVDVVMHVGDSVTAEEALNTYQPHLVVWDCQLAADGYTAIVPWISQRSPGARVLAFGPLDERCVVDMIQAGAVGYIEYGEALDNIVGAVEKVGQGGHWYSSTVVPFLVNTHHAAPDAPDEESRPPVHLTPRQQEALDLVAQGKSNKEIAQILGIKPKTVEEHLSAIYDRLHVSGRAAAAAWYAAWKERGQTSDT